MNREFDKRSEQGLLLHHLLEAAADRYPDAVAVVDGDRTMTYRELDVRANQLSHLLVTVGVTRGDRVALYLDKSLEAIVGVYAILKAGGAYVPIDPMAPTDRCAYVVHDCRVRCLVSATSKQVPANEIVSASGVPALVVLAGEPGSGDGTSENLPQTNGTVIAGRVALDDQPTSRLNVRGIDADLAYILYTSGSTGRPKGVMLTHRNALAFVLWAADEFGVNSDDVLSSVAPLHFDLSIFDLFAAARAAATLVLAPARATMFPVETARFIEAHGITVWYSVPSLLTMLVQRGGLTTGRLPTLRVLLFAGEVFPTRFLRELMHLIPQARFVDLYGPTETNVCTWYDVPPLPEEMTEPIPIGVPVPNDDLLVVTDDGRRAEAGEVGELYVRGATVMRGYWGDDERTARSLVVDPLDNGAGDVAYRTGDLVRDDGDGVLHFLGRRDNQVKTRGYRVELGEIESVLYGHPAVVECAVVAVPDEVVTSRLRAFVVSRPNVTVADLVEYASMSLPRYMIPETVVFRDQLPKTSTGKIDRRELQAEASRGR